MDNETIIEYSRTKGDAKKIFLRKLWPKQIIPNIILVTLLIHASYLLGLIMGVAVCHGLGLDKGSHIFFTTFFTIFILNIFFAPVYKLYFLYKKQISEIYQNREILNIIFRISKDRFKYESETFSLDSLWTNTAMLKIDSDFIQFQTIVPKVYIFIPKSKISHEVENQLLTKISKSNHIGKGIRLENKIN